MLLRSTTKMSFFQVHCVIHPDMWQELRINLTFMFQGEEPIAEFAINIHFPDPTNPGQDSWKSKVII